MNKRCSFCKQTKPPKDFYKNKARKSGLSYYCKICSKKFTLCWRRTKRGKTLSKEVNKRYRKTVKGKAMRHREWLRIKGSLAVHIHQVISNIKSRCENPQAKDYEYYGGRGIKCYFNSVDLHQWLIQNNIDPRGKQIHRVDNDDDYTLDNIEFLLQKKHLEKHYEKYKAITAN